MAEPGVAAVASAFEIVDQSVGIPDIASRKVRLVLDDLATLLRQPGLGFFNILDRHLQHGAENGSPLNEQIMCLP